MGKTAVVTSQVQRHLPPLGEGDKLLLRSRSAGLQETLPQTLSERALRSLCHWAQSMGCPPGHIGEGGSPSCPDGPWGGGGGQSDTQHPPPRSPEHSADCLKHHFAA